MQPGDVVVATNVAPYTRSVAEAAAKQTELSVIALTDTLASPPVPPADRAFVIPHESGFFSNSMSAYLVFSEGLLNLVATRLGKRWNGVSG